MIEKLELKEVLELNRCSKKIIKEYCNKKTLLRDGNKDEIAKILKILIKENLDLSKCATVLVQGNSQNIEEIINILKNEHLDVNNFISVLSRKNFSEISKIIEELRKLNLNLDKCVTIIAKGNLLSVKKITEILNREELDASKCLTILSKTNIDELEEMLKILKSENIKKCHWLTILSRANLLNLKRNIKILKNEKLCLDNFIRVLARGNSEEVKKIIPLLKDEGIDLNLCSTVLAQGNYENIKEVLKKLKKNNISISNCITVLLSNPSDLDKKISFLKNEYISLKSWPLILSRKKYEELVDISNVIKKYKNLDIHLRDCPIILAYGNALEISKILSFVEKHNINISNNLSVLAYGKINSIKKIYKLFKNNNIDINCFPGLLCETNYLKIEKIFQLLKDHKCSIKNIFYLKLADKIFFGFGYDKLSEIFYRKESGNLEKEEIKLLFKLEGRFNKYYDINEIEYFCVKYNIPIKEFLELFCHCKNELTESLINRLQNNEKIWIGDYYPLISEDLKKYENIIIKASKVASKRFVFFTGFTDISEATSNSGEILIKYCGPIFYNYSNNQKLLISILINYCYKSLYRCIIPKSYFHENQKYNFYDEETDYISEFDEMETFKNIGLTNEEKEFLDYMNILLINENENYPKELKEKFNLDDNNYEQVIKRIRLKVQKDMSKR